MLWRRPDGDLVRDLPPTKGIVPYLMRGRNESAVYFEQQVAMRHTDAYVREFNVAHPDTPITVQHLLMWAICQILDQHPSMNRFVVGGRLYQRRDIWFTYSAKQSLKGKSPLIVIKRRFDPAESFVDMVADMQAQLRSDRYGGEVSASDKEAALILRFPGVVRRVILAAGRVGDAFGLLPGSMIEHDPMYATRVLRQPGEHRDGPRATTTCTSTAASASSASSAGRSPIPAPPPAAPTAVGR